MKSVKGMIAVVALLLVSNAHAMSNYNNFQSGYRGEIISPSNNMVSMAWVQGSVDALLRDGAITNQEDSRIANILWNSLTPVLNYYMNMPQNRSNPYFRDRIWQSLTRSIAEMPRTMPSGANQAQEALADIETLKTLASARDLASQIIRVNPATFYYAGSINPSWLRDTLNTALGNGRRQLTTQNREDIKKALVDIVEVLMLQMFVEGNNRLNPRVQDAIILGVKNQVAQFIDAQPVSR